METLGEKLETWADESSEEEKKEETEKKKTALELEKKRKMSRSTDILGQKDRAPPKQKAPPGAQAQLKKKQMQEVQLVRICLRHLRPKKKEKKKNAGAVCILTKCARRGRVCMEIFVPLLTVQRKLGKAMPTSRLTGRDEASKEGQ